MQAAGQWKLIQDDLGADWDEAHLVFSVEDPGTIGAAAAVLAPLGPGRSGKELKFQVRREGGGPDKVRNLVGPLDRKRIWGTLTLVGSQAEPHIAPAGTEPEDEVRLVESWTQRSRRFHQDGVISCASSSSTRRTTSPGRRCSARH